MSWTGNQATWSHPSGWQTKYVTATRSAAASIDGTDFDYDRLDTAAVGLRWRKRNYGETHWDGLASRTFYVESCELIHVDTYYNTFYTDAYSLSKVQSVGAHEMGHGIGMRHFKDGCSLASIMQKTTPCRWGNLGVNAVTNHDAGDINDVY